MKIWKGTFAILTTLTLLVGCDWFDDKVTVAPEQQAYLIPERHIENVKLQKLSAKTLSNEQLYRRALSLWPVAYRELSIPTSLGQARVIVAGPEDAEAVVLLHGMQANSAMWYPNIAALAEHYRVYAIDDLLGSGGSLADTDISGMTQVVSWYQELFDLLQLDSINLVGASRGGWQATAIALAESNNEMSRIQALVLLSPAQTFGWIELSGDLLSSILFTLNPVRDEVQESLKTLSTKVYLINSIYLDQYVAALDDNPVPGLITEMRPFSDQQLQQITLPTLVMIGDNDIMNNQDSLERANKMLKKVQTIQIQDAGHFLTVDQAEQVNRAVLDFLSL
ncbi:alpha/beta hydrolase [Pseudoalteromonas sp. SWYJ118]|uniref:alpha/beta fold hydrolase n=1 Tax=Pseudoalteromonas sp. SWYJ118 TaxID=2792062 RepID=UPI0018CCE523|nr:alpha/beta hydrolase [Pseudoalteromonas sp. SWYJ118]MBH0076557.1 alpha/beta hydrolase [Pseudoalteromonas sp. SWYJ118]